jgi:phosphoenolpyruvate synthase/pyruvate phosphate dikinase
MAIAAARKAGKYVGICGQGPSDHPDFAAWLVEQGIDSVSSTRIPWSTPGSIWPSSTRPAKPVPAF